MAPKSKMFYIPINEKGEIIDNVALTYKQMKSYVPRKTSKEIQKYHRMMRIAHIVCKDIMRDIDTTDNLYDREDEHRKRYWLYTYRPMRMDWDDDMKYLFRRFYNFNRNVFEIPFYEVSRTDMKSYFSAHVYAPAIGELQAKIATCQAEMMAPRFRRVRHPL